MITIPKGFSSAKKVGDMQGRGTGFHGYPKGTRFSMKDGQVARVRFIQAHDDIEWVRKWKLPPSGNFKYGELVNCVDQHEDGTPDPGYTANLKTSFKAYPLLIWRNAPDYQKAADGKFVRDPQTNKIIPTGTVSDKLAFWECSYAVYEMLAEKHSKWGGLTNTDAEIKRIGADKSTKYAIEPFDFMKMNEPFSDADRRLVQSSKIDLSEVLKVPDYDTLNKYLNPGQNETPNLETQAENNSQADAGPNPFLA